MRRLVGKRSIQHSFLGLGLPGTTGMVVRAVVILVLFAWNSPGSFRRLSKSMADFKKARDDVEDRHGL